MSYHVMGVLLNDILMIGSIDIVIIFGSDYRRSSTLIISIGIEYRRRVPDFGGQFLDTDPISVDIGTFVVSLLTYLKPTQKEYQYVAQKNTHIIG